MTPPLGKCSATSLIVSLQDVKILHTKGQPAVYGQWLHAAGAPTVLIYGHYGKSHSNLRTSLPLCPVHATCDTSDGAGIAVDVQPVDPLDLWTSPPFEPTVSRTGKGQGYFRGRGVSDDKGGLLQPIHVRTLLRSLVFMCACAYACIPAEVFLTLANKTMCVRM